MISCLIFDSQIHSFRSQTAVVDFRLELDLNEAKEKISLSVVVNSRQFWVKFDTVLRLMNTLARTINCGIFLALEYEKKIRQRDFFQRLCTVVCSFTVYSMVLIVQVNCLAMLPFAFAVRRIQKVQLTLRSYMKVFGFFLTTYPPSLTVST